MINYLTGTIRALTREPGRAVIVTGGVGYEVSLPAYVYQSMSDEGIREGSKIELEIYLLHQMLVVLFSIWLGGFCHFQYHCSHLVHR